VPAPEIAMSYRSLLVFLDSHPLCSIRTQVAIRLARSLDCHLVGVAPTGLIELPAPPEATASLGKFGALAWDVLRDQAERAAQAFREACSAAGIKSFEALSDEADKSTSLVRHAHCSDLCVLTQAEPGTGDHHMAQDLVEQVVLFSARPTLILPYAGRFASIGSKVMVAWDDSRESARALSDALPLLRLAQRVQVVSWNKPGSGDEQPLRPRVDALRQWLMWQGVAADVRIETTDIHIAEAMLSRAADLEVDLIVMGAYGHARLTERVLGGATRGMLNSMTVPVLMSH
jgi:nucleotide-binding universal stress UspA family protein